MKNLTLILNDQTFKIKTSYSGSKNTWKVPICYEHCVIAKTNAKFIEIPAFTITSIIYTLNIFPFLFHLNSNKKIN